ncbi:putative Polycomb group protein ASXL2 isoform X1 [Synchiropus splendidus]|uniref:putative Polycomb group protein ASXL2 isoform X1 n=2 Tax=Synchiropus splendidus TaxID=270530 RepID=UPI00237E6980|nr:putative Polycomb group protein ASXL2 isoform X1 [Synchiropus splendidus]
MRERQKKKKGRTWAEAAKTVLEKYPNTPMSHKEILQVIQRERLKEISGTSPLACLNAMLHTNSRGEEGIFYKVPGRMGVYTLKKDSSDGAKELSDEGSEESSDNLSDSRSSENNSAINQEGRRGRWMRRVPANLQPSSPQPRCSSPSVTSAKIISPSQKHSKKALKQALKQQQQRNQRRQGAMPTTSSPRLLLKTIKNMAENMASKSELCHSVIPRKASARSSRLSPGHLRRSRCQIDVETPDSILVNTNLRAIINKHTFSVLPPDCQQKLLKLLPEVDQQACMDGLLKVTSSALNNEFFTSAAQSWKERLAEGEFTPELQLRMRQEIEKERKVEHWKETFFESYYGENSGLSLEESKELTMAGVTEKPDRCQTSIQQTESSVKALQEIKSNKDSGLADPLQTTAKDGKTTKVQEPLKVRHREPFPAAEPMRTRRSLYAENRKINAATQAAAQVETSTSDAAPELEDVREQSLVKESPALQASPELKEAPLVSGLRASQESEEVSSDGSALQLLKRKALPTGFEEEVTPEKRQCQSSASSVSSVSPSASSISSPATPTPPMSQRVPPLKIPVSRILPVPVCPSPLSPRSSPAAVLSSPARTGARTLADIKAKAQLARAQRVAAAAGTSSSKAAVPGPGPGGGSDSTQPSPCPSPKSPQVTSRFPVSSSSQICSSSPSCGGSLNSPQTLNSHKTDPRLEGQSPPGPEQTGPGPAPQPVQEGHAAAVSRTSSCIPANNPLVTQLLQGKEVPLEKILPKPLAKMERRMTNLPVANKVKPHSSAAPSAQPEELSLAGSSDCVRPHRELPDQETQEQILQTLMQRKVLLHQPARGLEPRRLQYHDHQASHPEPRRRISLGLSRRKKIPRPAMTGHYLLNVSTYGRASESRRLHGLKREGEGAEEGVKLEAMAVKTEQQAEPVTASDIKREPDSEDAEAPGTNRGGATFSQLPELKPCNNNLGKSEPYKDLSHQQPMETLDNQVATRCFGSTSVPHTVNSAGAVSSTPLADGAGVMSFSVTVTTIPARHALDHQGEPSPDQTFLEGPSMEEVQSKCYCQLKAMIMCKGCGAFCHDDCIGPSKLCVSCLVVR